MEKVKNLVLTLNKQAVKLIKEASHHSAINRLDQALQVLQMNFSPDHSHLYFLTYNNYGLILKKHNKLQQALNCFLTASEYCSEHSPQLAECLLRACNLSSKLNNHQQALDLALKSLKVLSKTDNHIKIIAFQNAGAEYEYLNMKTEAVKMYKSGYGFVKKLFGKFNSVALMFKKRFAAIGDVKESVKPLSSINIITNKPFRYEQVSKTPDLKNFRKEEKVFGNEIGSLRMFKNSISGKERIQSMSPGLKSRGFGERSEDRLLSSLKEKRVESRKRREMDELYMIDTLRVTPKIYNSSLKIHKNAKINPINVE